MSAATASHADRPEVVSVAVAAARLGISAAGYYNAAARGELPALRIGRRRWVVPTHQLDLLIAGKDWSC